ncbi:hypothetical protein CC1G_02114 [Coprinopsis cinerea okayama7|uniref:Glycosyltransferase 61 catalytic domain-containing protein n=1 Tax=Coprinopsis cinerea (strain Okayama-7 / 130 / ATCC MYA-4618 / FGSC 9003) TaxID=240176 RepID=A8NK87_COPC7|nr:hypothetical protein CC1G_02114 [Coprinopsis cinerea okayama7\|eukprot:XP_001834378.2 hypothetical protein CC1G_02114 [Coprinopsis cinerea okayama7\
MNQLNQVNLLNQVNEVKVHHTTSTSTVLTTATSTKTVTTTSTEALTPQSTPILNFDEEWHYHDLDKFLSSSSDGTAHPFTIHDETDPSDPLPPSRLVAHAPGWTLIRNLYMSNGTLYILLPDGVNPTTPSLSPDHPEYYGHGGKDISYGYTSAPGWPQIRRMTSPGKTAYATAESETEREPSVYDMQFVGMKEGRTRWGGRVLKKSASGKEEKEERVWVVKGNTLLFNDPPQFLRHYYHFVAELFLGVQAFWSSAFSKPDNTNLANHFSTVWESSQAAFLSSSPSTPNSPISPTSNATTVPPIHRAIFIHSNWDGWRDDPGFNAYFLRGVFASLTVEHQEDWQDRVRASALGVSDGSTGERVWRFPLVLLTDRSAAHRGVVCGSRTQRTAAEAWDYMRRMGRLRGLAVGGWWAPIREAMWRFAGVDGWKEDGGVIDGAQVIERMDEKAKDDMRVIVDRTLDEIEEYEKNSSLLEGESESWEERSRLLDVRDEWQSVLPMPEEVVITYISRQSARHRKLLKEDHEGLVKALKALVKRKNEERGSDTRSSKLPPKWTLDILEAEHLTKDAQVHAAARTTFMLGVHGNGLTHLVWMKPTAISTVIELFCPGGFSHDYQWTSRSLGINHWAVWHDEIKGGKLSGEGKPDVNYPECFQGDEIPVDGEFVARMIEERVEEGVRRERERERR